MVSILMFQFLESKSMRYGFCLMSFFMWTFNAGVVGTRIEVALGRDTLPRVTYRISVCFAGKGIEVAPGRDTLHPVTWLL